MVYGGQPLRAGQRVYWKVRAWDRDDRPSAYSAAAWWEMGLLAPADWRAAWITRKRAEPLSEQKLFEDDPAPLFRKEFLLDKKIRRARVYVSGLGYYELRLNGQRVGDQVLDPGWTTYSKRVLYSTYDVTDQLKRGQNALGVMLGNGWFNPLPLRLWGHINPREHLTIGEPRVIVQLVAEFADGTSQTIVTDESWKVSNGPILRNSVYLGEVYDARKEQPGWDEPGFDDSGWQQAVGATEPLGPLARAERAADSGHPGAQAGQAHRAEAGRLDLRPGPELRRLGSAARAGSRRHARQNAVRRTALPGRHTQRDDRGLRPDQTGRTQLPLRWDWRAEDRVADG